MKTNNNIPAYRFQGYTDAWELRKLGEVAEIVMGQSPDSKNYTDNPLDNILVQGNADLRDGCVVPRVWTTQVTKTAENGDLILSVRAPVGDVGRTNYNVVLGRGVAGIKGNEFIYHLLVKMKLFGYWTKLSTGSTFESINSDDIKNSIILFPSLPEQEAIGTFFSILDRHITLHQRKLDTLKEQKKTYLKLLFPAKGQTKPALRFQGFEDDWEVKRISDIGDIVTGNTPSTSNEDYYSNEGMMWVTPTDIDGLIITDTNKKLSPEGEKVSRIVPANSILVTCIASIGKNTLLLEAGSFNQQINAVVPNQSLYHSYFLLTQSYFWSESMKRIAPAATMQI
ncbi:TPA: restriction endonuclease subunit S, partial [Streptococcus suis]